uniref:C2H2-type domain-containing protein n=1 Tax=Megaselia scalaris TaxID=36166 RepID=T1GJH4_MEGSC
MECGKGFYRKDHLRKHTRSHIARRVKAELTQNQQNGSTSESGGPSQNQVQHNGQQIMQQTQIQQLSTSSVFVFTVVDRRYYNQPQKTPLALLEILRNASEGNILLVFLRSLKDIFNIFCICHGASNTRDSFSISISKSSESVES